MRVSAIYSIVFQYCGKTIMRKCLRPQVDLVTHPFIIIFNPWLRGTVNINSIQENPHISSLWELLTYTHIDQVKNLLKKVSFDWAHHRICVKPLCPTGLYQVRTYQLIWVSKGQQPYPTSWINHRKLTLKHFRQGYTTCFHTRPFSL